MPRIGRTVCADSCAQAADHPPTAGDVPVTGPTSADDRRDPHREPLSCERIVSAAVRYVDRDCLAGLSMRRLGAELGVEAMSLYRYFPSKAALLEAVVGRVLGDLVLPGPGAGRDWEDQVRAYARSFRGVAAAHPHLMPLLASVGPADPTLAAIDRRLVGSWREAGLDESTATRAQAALQGYLAGTCLWDAAGKVDRDAADAAFELGLDALLNGLRLRVGARELVGAPVAGT